MSFFDFTVKNNEEVILDVCKTPIQNKLFRDTIDKFHSYVKYKDSPTRNIRYLIYEARTGNHIGSIGLSSATLAVSCRDNFIGWSNDAKMKNLNKVANNSRFCLIGKNVTIENAGSQTLKRLRIDGALEWKRKYGDELILIETFILPTRDSEYNGQNTRNGSVYKADNWIEA
jgi:hypothetical protein